MTSKDQLYLAMEKQALMGAVKNYAGQAGGWLAKKVSQKGFTGGLLAPVSKLYGGAQKLYGRGQQAVAGIKNNPALYARGEANVAKGVAQRESAGLRNGVMGPGRSWGFNKDFGRRLEGPSNPWQYRVGRGVGAVAIGAPIAYSPITMSSLAGSASADPELVKGYAKGQVQDRINQHMQQFASMPFMDRMRTAWNPEEFNNNILANSAQYQDLNAGIQGGHATNNPGIMKYLASFNPFLGIDPVKQTVRSEILNAAGVGKSAMEKEALNPIPFLKNTIMPAWQAGRRFAAGKNNVALGEKIYGDVAAVGNKLVDAGKAHIGDLPALPRASRLLDQGRLGMRNAEIIKNEALKNNAGHIGKDWLTNTAYNVAQRPGHYAGKAALGVGGAALTPYFVASAYGEGKNKVYDQAANDAMGLADAQFTNQFAGMNPFMRMGGALFPGMAQDYVNGQMNSAFYPSPTDRGAAMQQQSWRQSWAARNPAFHGLPPPQHRGLGDSSNPVSM